MKQLLPIVAVANFVLFTAVDSFDICQPSFSKLPVVISLLNINCNDMRSFTKQTIGLPLAPHAITRSPRTDLLTWAEMFASSCHTSGIADKVTSSGCYLK